VPEAQKCPHCGNSSLQKRGLTKTEEPKQRYACNECSRWFVTSLVDLKNGPEFFLDRKRAAILEKKERYIITSSQNNTHVDNKFWEALKNYAKENKSQLVVLPLRYRNPTSYLQPQDDDDNVWWPEEVSEYLVENCLKIHPKLWIMGNMRIQATTTNPLTGLESLSQHASAIYGHGQLQMKVVPTPQNDLPKILHTTGSCSVENYSKSKAGLKGEFHHTKSALVVEKKDKKFHMRVVIWDGECFYDLDKKYTNTEVTKGHRVDALVTGDEHAIFNDPKVRSATYDDKDSIAATLKPKVIVRHDVFDGYSISHHHRHNPVTQYVKWKENLNKVEDELNATVLFIEETTPEGSENVIVASNHNEHLNRWLREVDWKLEPWNAEIYHWFWYHMLREAKFDEFGARSFDPFAFWAKDRINVPTKFLSRNETYVINNICLDMHGDIGPNGGRGSAVNLNKIGIRSIIGHCLTGKHDVLTRNGWEPIVNVPAGEEILTIKDGHNIWSKTTDKQEYLYTGRLINLGRFGQTVTPNHKLALKDGSMVPVCEAIMTRKSNEVPISAKPLLDEGIEIPEATLRKIVAVCADGNFYKKSLSFNLKKPRKHERLKLLFGDDLRYTDAKRKNGSVRRTVSMSSSSYKEVVNYIEPYTETKVIPNWFINLSEKCRKIVIDELVYWDGSGRNCESNKQFSTSKEDEANIIAALCTLQGYRTTFLKRIDHKYTTYVITWTEGKPKEGTNQEHDAMRIGSWQYSTTRVKNEPVYCFTVPETHCFWVRDQKTGKISLTGNSHTPCIEKGVFQVGTSTRLRLEYTFGPSSWLNTHAVVYPNGKRSLLHVIEGEWKG